MGADVSTKRQKKRAQSTLAVYTQTQHTIPTHAGLCPPELAGKEGGSDHIKKTFQ